MSRPGPKPQPRQPFIGPLLEGTRMIPLTQGQYAKVAEDHYDWLMQGPLWYARWNPGTKSFYAQRNVPRGDGRRILELMHQLITGFRWEVVDHINHDTLDNLPPNLRDGTLHNNENQRIRAGGTSQYHGVCWHVRDQHWRAQIKVNGKLINLGSFDSELDAAQAYDEASRKYHGAYGTRNFPLPGETGALR